MRQSPRNGVIIAWLAALGGGLLLAFGPPTLGTNLQALSADVAKLGLSVLGQTSRGSSADVAAMESLTHANHALRQQVAELQERLAQYESRQIDPLAAAQPLLQSELVSTRVLGETGSLSTVSNRLLGLGSQHGLTGEELVLDGAGVLLDQGSEAGLGPDQLVADGRSVLGRVTRVGRWTSTFQPVTSPDFRASVRLIRSSVAGPVYGARGVLAGTGTGCRLEHVPASEAVSVGDSVYHDDVSTSAPLIIGRVTRADLQPADPFWTIEVTPVTPLRSRDVFVVKTRFNPLRLAEAGLKNP